MKTLTLKRIIDKSQIINATGIWGQVFNEYGQLICNSIERPWLENQRGISCIPTGKYKCVRDNYGRHQYWRVENVEGRDNIEIHSANRPDQLNGCIAFGENWSIMNGNIAITNSKKTLDKLLEEYPEGFELEIINNTSFF
jgi:hypothetical protein